MTSSERPIRIAITLGDPRGIGPEIVEKALAHPSLSGLAEWTVVSPTSKATTTEADAGRQSAEMIEAAVRMAREGKVDAIVTAPIDKHALTAAGLSWPGHTEWIAALTNTAHVTMLLSAERTLLGHPLRVALATTHHALRNVPTLLNADLFVQRTVVLNAGLQKGWSIPQPRIAMCAINPHASDGGRFGDEEATILGPAIDQLIELGIDARGPFPADTIFRRAAVGEFNAVMAPYHDVGMAAFKTAAFGAGVNVTLGLPFPRTSPDHGTALDIAGLGIADPSSMVEAMVTAHRLALAQRHEDF